MMVPDYIADHVARQQIRHRAEHQADMLARSARAERLENGTALLSDIFDPTASGPSGVTGYAWIAARGD
jgi:hypothetical protein